MVGTSDSPTRAVIAQSWQRAALSGLDPGASADSIGLEEIDRNSRFMAAAGPVLDELATELDGTGFSAILADSAARIVDLRVGMPALRPMLEEVGASEGRRFVEETTGTNSIATAFELRSGVSVHGEEHFVDALKQFSCYGHPVLHPVTRRLEGVLDITCLASQETPLLALFVMRAVRQIEERLLAGSGEAERRLLAAFQRTVRRDRNRPVVAMAGDVFLANSCALELLDSADHAVLQGMAVDGSVTRRRSLPMRLATGQDVVADCERVAHGAVFTFEQVKQRLDLPRGRRETSVLVHGEAGTGRTSALRALAGESLVSMDAAEIAEHGVRPWLTRLETRLGADAPVAVESVHLLPEPVARRVAALLRRTQARVLLSSAPVRELHGEHAGLVAHCAERMELTPLRNRRDEIPALIQAMLADLGAPRELRFTPSAMEALTSQEWPGNLRELYSVVRAVVHTRGVGDVAVRDLPEAYWGRARGRRLTLMEQAERDAIVEALRATGGNKKDAAKRLGISRTTLYNGIRTLGIVTPASGA